MGKPLAFYNENDPKAAAWLRELIKTELIAEGIVDERDIRDIRPDELRDYTQCHFFAGIGGWSLALRLAGWPDDRPVWTGSCPCQPFSAAGRGKGFADERHLWPHWFHLIQECQPPIVFGEQVASKDGLGWFDTVQTDLEATGYAVGAADLCAAGLGAPHIRQRLWFVAEALADPGRASDERIRRSGQASRAPGQDENQTQQWKRSGSTDRSSVSLGSLADASIKRQPGSGKLGEPSHSTPDTVGEIDRIINAGGCVRVADLQGAERKRTSHTRARRAGSSNSSDDVCPMANTNGRDGGKAGAERGGEYRQFSQNTSPMHRDNRPGPTNGFWRAADWLHCQDGKWRPVEPGTFPLSHGVSGRMGLLRGYGNAIVPQVAQRFIEAFMEI